MDIKIDKGSHISGKYVCFCFGPRVSKPSPHPFSEWFSLSFKEQSALLSERLGKLKLLCVSTVL